MTSINFHLRPSTKAGYNEGKLFIRIIHNRKPKNLVTDYRVFPHEWDQAGRRVLLPDNDPYRAVYLGGIQSRMADDISRIRAVVKLLSRQGSYTVEDIAKGVELKVRANTVWSFSEMLGAKLRESGKDRTARAYRTAAKSLIAYNKGIDLKLEQIDEELIRDYEKHLKDRGLELNTISFYLRNLRAIYFKAVRARVILPKFVNPFLGLSTGIYESKKRALNHGQINALSALEAEIVSRIEEERRKGDAGGRPIVRSRNLHGSLLYFMFCYHARGMSFVDLAYLKKADIAEGIITYRRRKTGGLLHVGITEPMRKIIRYFEDRTRHSDYVFPIIDGLRGPARVQYESGLKIQNKRLKTLGDMAGIEALTTHVARHTWATLAKKEMIDIPLISEALGHKDTKTTLRYLGQFDQSTMDMVSKKMSGIIEKAA